MTKPPGEPRIHLHGVSKAYGGLLALQDVNLSLTGGEIHGLCGENGAGKSTLIKILTGVVRPDSGHLAFDGQSLPLGNVPLCERLGIVAMHQESTAFPDLNAIDNLFVGRELTRFGGLLLDRAEMRRQAAQIFSRLGVSIDFRIPLGRLPLAQRQLVAMARAIACNCGLLIMDEPTASLSSRETDRLLEIVCALRDSGVTILYVSHRLEEVFSIADRITILRDGRHVATCPAFELTQAQLVRMMVGRDIPPLETVSQSRTPRLDRPASTLENENCVLEVDGLSRGSTLDAISFAIARGEVVGLAGLVGAGRSELAKAIFGIDRYDVGEVRVNGRPLRAGSVVDAIKAGVALVPEDRQHEGLVLPMSVASNLSMARLSALTRRGMIDSRAERTVVETQRDQLQIRAASADVAASTLSGGNQQKLVLGKWLAMQPKAIILDEPTRGVDVGAKSQFHELIRRLAAAGMAVLVISSDLTEILSIADRILVMREGRIAGQVIQPGATAEEVMRLALPIANADAPSRCNADE